MRPSAVLRGEDGAPFVEVLDGMCVHDTATPSGTGAKERHGSACHAVRHLAARGVAMRVRGAAGRLSAGRRHGTAGSPVMTSVAKCTADVGRRGILSMPYGPNGVLATRRVESATAVAPEATSTTDDYGAAPTLGRFTASRSGLL